VPDWASAFRPPTATAAPAAVGTVVNDHSVNTAAPVTNVNVTLDGRGDDATVGNRVGKAGAKAAAPINLEAARRALVPTPGT
jgi:hypothetical protein